MRLHDQVAIVTGVSHAGQVGYTFAAAMQSMLSCCNGVPQRASEQSDLLAEFLTMCGVQQ